MARADKSRRGKGKPSKHGELRSGPVAGTAFVDGVTFARKGVQYANVDGIAIFEGDIVLGKVKDLKQAEADGRQPMPESIGITGQQFRWPNGVVGLRHRSRPSQPAARHHRDRPLGGQHADPLPAAHPGERGAESQLRPLRLGRRLLLAGRNGGRAAGHHARPELQRRQRDPRDRPLGRPLARAEPRGPRHLRADRVRQHRPGDAAQLPAAHHRRRRPGRPTTTARSCTTRRRRSRSTARRRSSRARRCRREW